MVEVSVPKEGAPRPIRLAVKKNGVMTPLDLEAAVAGRLISAHDVEAKRLAGSVRSLRDSAPAHVV